MVIVSRKYLEIRRTWRCVQLYVTVCVSARWALDRAMTLTFDLLTPKLTRSSLSQNASTLKFGEMQSSDLQDIALTRPKSAFSRILDLTVSLKFYFWPQNLMRSPLSQMQQCLVWWKLCTIVFKVLCSQSLGCTDRRTNEQPEKWKHNAARWPLCWQRHKN